MKGKWLWNVVIMIVCVSCAIAGDFFYQQTVTLQPPHDKTTGKYDEGRACFSFKQGLRKDASNGDWDLGYGFAAINNEDWFILQTSTESRSVIKDLGEFTWIDSLEVLLPDFLEADSIAERVRTNNVRLPLLAHVEIASAITTSTTTSRECA